MNATRTGLAGVLAIGLLAGASAAWADAASDEANRQAMMADMRASAAANDRANAESLQRNQADYDRNHNGGGSSGASSSSGSGGSSGGGGGFASHDAAPRGPQSVVATYNFTVYRQETPAAVTARLAREADAGNALSAFNLGRIFYTGFDGAPRDDAKARHWFGEAARLGHPGGESQFGYMLHDGIGGPADSSGAMDWLKKAADQGDVYGEALYGYYQVGLHSSEPNADLGQPIAYLTDAADHGQMLAQATLGTIVYEMGVGTAVDWDKAAHYSRLAADQGYALAQTELARMYLSGRGVEKNDEVAIALLHKAAAQKNATSMTILAQLAFTGRGMPQDEAVGADWFRQAADAGDADAAANYGVLLLNGQGVAKDETAALRYTRLAAEAGSDQGQLHLAMDYMFGHGVAIDMHQAYAWFSKAAAQGNDQAIAALKDPAVAAAGGSQ